jgi:hypothetical protein
MISFHLVSVGLFVVALAAIACSGKVAGNPGTGGGLAASGATSNVGGGTASAGTHATGGSTSIVGGGAATGGTVTIGGATSSVVGGATATGGTVAGLTGTCQYNNQTYSAFNDIFPSTSDACLQCCCSNRWTSCFYNSCSDPGASGCLHFGRTYAPGSCMPDQDNCNTLQCVGNNTVNSTGIACSCSPTTEWWRHYVATGSCATIDYTCPANTWSFTNSCGCGCEESLGNCPSYFDCMPGPNTPSPCPTAEQSALCPYTLIAL